MLTSEQDFSSLGKTFHGLLFWCRLLTRTVYICEWPLKLCICECIVIFQLIYLFCSYFFLLFLFFFSSYVNFRLIQLNINVVCYDYIYMCIYICLYTYIDTVRVWTRFKSVMASRSPCKKRKNSKEARALFTYFHVYICILRVACLFLHVCTYTYM